jgi:hypothetical protein
MGKGKVVIAALVSAFLIVAVMVLFDMAALGIALGSAVIMLLLIYLMLSSLRNESR